MDICKLYAQQPSNYSPISLTCIAVKCLERIIHSNVSKFLNENDQLSIYQHGFRHKFSCQTQLLSTIYDWTKCLEKRELVHAIFLDFSKAFDSVPHQRLSMKLKWIGVDGNLLSWIEAFISNRKQRVMINGVSSPWGSVISGVPQGSIIGPLLFLIYVNDIFDAVSTSHIKMFADDRSLYSYK